MRSLTLESHRYQPNARHPQRRVQGTQQFEKLSAHQQHMLLEYQLLWQRLALRLLRSENLVTPWVVGVTSSIRGEGKTTVSIGLAMALAQETQEKVALIEANFQNPTLAKDFGVDGEPGLINYLLSRNLLWEICKATGNDRLALITAGSVPRTVNGMTTEKLRGHLRRQLPEVVGQLGTDFSYIVLDLPPILGNIDTEEMLRLVHGTVLVVRSGVTPLERFRQAAQRLDSGRLLGVVQLGDRPSIPRWLSQLISE